MTKNTNDVTKKLSFLDNSKRILKEEKELLKISSGKEMTEERKSPIRNSDNMSEAEPDINQLFRNR